MNRFEIIGNLTRNPELTETATGTPVCRFTVAVNRSYNSSDGERKSDFFNCVAWRGKGEAIAKFARKGDKIGVSAHVETRSYEDNKGVRHNTIDVIVDDVDFLSKKHEDDDNGFYPDEPAPEDVYQEDPDCPF